MTQAVGGPVREMVASVMQASRTPPKPQGTLQPTASGRPMIRNPCHIANRKGCSLTLPVQLINESEIENQHAAVHCLLGKGASVAQVPRAPPMSRTGRMSMALSEQTKLKIVRAETMTGQTRTVTVPLKKMFVNCLSACVRGQVLFKF